MNLYNNDTPYTDQLLENGYIIKDATIKSIRYDLSELGQSINLLIKYDEIKTDDYYNNEPYTKGVYQSVNILFNKTSVIYKLVAIVFGLNSVHSEDININNILNAPIRLAFREDEYDRDYFIGNIDKDIWLQVNSNIGFAHDTFIDDLNSIQ